MNTTTERKPRTRKPYDPGQPAGVEKINFRQGLFLVKPFRRNDGKQASGDYQVDLEALTCTCPHFCNRIAPALEAGEEPEERTCKHIQAAQEESREIALHVARQLSTANLSTQEGRTDLRPEIKDAILQVRWERLNTRPGSLSLPALLSTVRHHAEDERRTAPTV